MANNTSAISIKEFVEKLTAGGGINPSPADCVEYGCGQGWLEEQDAAGQEEALLRKHAARMIHNFLRLELKEADEIDGSPAYHLQDLFDCRVCAGHIIQVYIKGIMDGVVLESGKLIFSGDGSVSEDGAQQMIMRIFEPEKRENKKIYLQRICPEPKKITLEEMEKLRNEKCGVLLVDVRTRREYAEACLQGAVNVPFLDIIKNPFLFSENRDTWILVYCNEGYQSMAAAQCLLEVGYSKVAYFVWKAVM